MPAAERQFRARVDDLKDLVSVAVLIRRRRELAAPTGPQRDVEASAQGHGGPVLRFECVAHPGDGPDTFASARPTTRPRSGPNLVGADDLAWANAQIATAFNVALVAGPLIGGALVAVSGASLVFAINAASFAASGLMIALTSGSFGGRREHSIGHSGTDLFAGFRFILSNNRLAPLAAASALAYGSFGAALVIDPALSRYFHAGAIGYGLLTTVWGAGAVLGALVAGRTVTVSRARRAVVWGMAAMAISLGSIVVLPSFPLIVAAGAIGGAGSGFVFIPWLLLIQHHSSDALRGRVVAAAEGFDQIAFLVGMGAAVPVITYANPHHAYALAGLMLGIATAITAVFSSTPDTIEPALDLAGLDE